MRGAIVGFGTIATGHLVAYEKIPNITINAVVDPVPARQQRACDLNPSLNTYSSLKEMFKSETRWYV